MKKIFVPLILVCVLSFWSCDSVQQAMSQMGTASNTSSNAPLSQTDIGNGLKAALEQGVDKQVKKLASKNGFFENEAAKILLPKELQKVEKGLRSVGLGNLADEGIKALNNTASDAVSRATPIFINAIKGMSFNDAKAILLDGNGAATEYLKNKTSEELYKEFEPVISQSFNRVGADKIWSNAINRYNALPLTESVNPDITEYVTQEALKGVFAMINKEEDNIRNNISARSTQLLQRVFSLQDGK